MIYGYCRISTRKQNIERQERNIKKLYPEAVIIKEIYTGTKFQGRKELDKLLSKVRVADTIVFDSVSRMSRNAEEGFELYKELYDKGIQLVFLKEHHIDTATYKTALEERYLDVSSFSTSDEDADKLIKGIFSALNNYAMRVAEKQIKIAFEQAEKEVFDLRQRTKEGIETARISGKRIGLKEGSKLITKKSVEAKKFIRKYNKDFDGTLNDIETIKMVGISRHTYYKYKKEMQEE